MRDYVIITDSTADLGKDYRDKFNIDYVHMNISYNGSEKIASLDWDEYSPKELYDLMRNGTRVFTTQVTTPTFIDKFKSYLSRGFDILYIACSSALSGSINVARIVCSELEKEYSDAKIICIDSLISSLGQGELALHAARLKKEGKTIEEVAEYIEENKLCINQFGTVENLEYLKRAGRIKASKAFFGNMFGVKPIIMSDAKGQNYAYKKVKGRTASLDELAQEIVNNAVDIENQIIYISHADDESSANYVAEKIKEKANPKGFYINYIGPIVGASVGPGTIIAFCVGKKIDIVGE